MNHALPSNRATGAALLDVVFTCGFIALLAAIAIPGLHASRERDATLLAARHLTSRLNMLRIEAIRRNRVVSMRLDPDDVGLFALYIDGDGDGVRQADVDAGVDQMMARASRVADAFAGVELRIPIDVPAPDGGSMLTANSDPVRIGSSNFLSFTPLGSATSGTIYLSGRGGALVAVRVFGATGRTRVLRFDRVSNAWRED